MKIIENKQSILRHYVGAPKRFLVKARDLYIDTMVNFEGKVGGGATHIPHLHKNFGRSNSTKQDIGKEKVDVDELYRSISKKCKWRDDTDRAKGYLTMDRSYSIAMGKMRTIDEEEPCDFYENVTVKSEFLFPIRSRSLAVTRRSNVY